MSHHRLIDEFEPDALAILKDDGIGVLVFDPVQRPRITLHVAGEADFDLPRRFAFREKRFLRLQVGVGEEFTTFRRRRFETAAVGVERVFRGATHDRAVRHSVCSGRQFLVFSHRAVAFMTGPVITAMTVFRHFHFTMHACHGWVERHVRHREKRIITHFWKFRQFEANVCYKRRAGHRCPAHAFGDDVERPGFFRTNDHIVSLSHRDAELIYLHWRDVIAVRLHDRHVETRDTDVKIGHRRRVDEAEPDPLLWLELRQEWRSRWSAINEGRVALNILNVGRHHPHLTPI